MSKKDDIKKRILLEVSMLLDEGLSINEIAKKTGIEPSYISRDLNSRLIKYFPELEEIVRPLVRSHNEGEFVTRQMKKPDLKKI